MSIYLIHPSVPDATTLMGFRHLLEANDLTAALVEVNVMLMERGPLMTKGTLVDATLIAAPSSTKNKEHGRDPEMHLAKKGRQWCFGIQAHIVVDKDFGLTVASAGRSCQAQCAIKKDLLTIHLQGAMVTRSRAGIAPAKGDKRHV